MEEQPQLRLFEDLAIEDEAKSYLLETARYAKYVGNVTIILAVVSLLKFIYVMIKTVGILRSLDYYFSFSGFSSLFVQLLTITVYFAIGFFTVRFSNKMKSSIEFLNQQDNDDAWHNLKMAYRICGLLMIICLLFILFAVLVFGVYL